MAKAKAAKAEVDALARYRAMRDFSTTAEPSGADAAALPVGGLPFVVQKHAATRLHYDFRLGWRGVLKSWAVAKGPSYNTADKRLAVQVEDHPIEYGGFEGAIPKGQYGGGTVLLWDQGTWEPLAGHDVDEGLASGSLKFTLHGTKLNGRWTLIRMGGRAAQEAKPNWLLIKEHDGNERPAAAALITDEAPNSVVTGRSLAAIAEAEDHVWNSRPAENGRAPANHSRLQNKLKNAHLHGTPVTREQAQQPEETATSLVKEAAGQASGKAAGRPPASSASRAATKIEDNSLDKSTPATADRAGTQASRKASRQKTINSSARQAPAQTRNPTVPAAQSTAAAWLEGAPAAAMPAFIPPQLAVPAAAIPRGAGWLHELKLDGYRIQAHVATSFEGKRRVTLYTRSGLDWTHRMRAVAAALEALPVEQAVCDGELVVLDEQGQSSFSKLQAAFEKGEAATFTYFLFDLLHLDGRDLRGLPLRVRKASLQPLVAAAASGLLLYSQHLDQPADAVYAHACELGAEGILSKNAEARYVSGRSDSWLKLKCTHRQEFVIAGFTLPKDGGSGVGSLLLGYYEQGRLVHCGRCGTGFSQATAKVVRRQMEPLRQDEPAYASPLSREARKDAIWLRPELVCEVQFATWTADGSLRHASFQGMRADKPATEVVAEHVKETADLAAEEAPDEQAAAEQTLGEPGSVSTRAGRVQAATQPEQPEQPEQPGQEDQEEQPDQEDQPNREPAREPGRKKGSRASRSPAGKRAAPKQPLEAAQAGSGKAASTPAPVEPQKAAGPKTQAPATRSAQIVSPPVDKSTRLPAAGHAPAKSPVRLTHPDKILDPASGTTKQQLADYLAAVAPAMLPHLAGRPTSIVRCPNGTAKPCFFQKHAAAGLPASLGAVAVPDRDNPSKTEPYITLESGDALVALAQLGVLELHPWGSQAVALEQPDRLILDLDPDEALPWETLVASAQSIRAFLRELQLESFVKTTGGKGLHLVVALKPGADWPQMRLFARGVAAAIESSDPKLYLIKMTKAARTGRIFLDWMRNERGATAVAPWSPRARAGMRVAVPLDWAELAAGPPAFSVANFAGWRDRILPANDPWAAMQPQTLDPAVLDAVLAQAGGDVVARAPRSKPRSRAR